MLRPVGDALENLVDPFEDLGRAAFGVLERVSSAGDSAAELFEGAASLAVGYASRAGIMRPPAFALLDVLASRGSDRDFDGLFVGAGGRTYGPSTPLPKLPAVVPSDGRAPAGTIVYVNGINTTKD